MFDNVIVGVGEHESWHDAIALAKQLVSTDGRLTLANIYVFGAEPRLSAGYTSQEEALERDRAAELLQRARAEAGRPAAARWRGAPCAVAMAPAGYARRACAIERVSVCYDGSAQELARTSTDVDLLVVGSRGHGPLGRLVSRRRYRSLAGVVQCPLLIVPRPAIKPM